MKCLTLAGFASNRCRRSSNRAVRLRQSVVLPQVFRPRFDGKTFRGRASDVRCRNKTPHRAAPSRLRTRENSSSAARNSSESFCLNLIFHRNQARALDPVGLRPPASVYANGPTPPRSAAVFGRREIRISTGDTPLCQSPLPGRKKCVPRCPAHIAPECTSGRPRTHVHQHEDRCCCARTHPIWRKRSASLCSSVTSLSSTPRLQTQ